ncbi:MAG: VOC family protein [Bacteroidota bacterium]|nr:VOC family protein [Bacteroidota bacterium]
MEPLQWFYTSVLGMEVLGSFQDHDGYDGIFIGLSGKDWHLEFTQNSDQPHQVWDEDDLLVFYPESVLQYQEILKRAEASELQKEIAKNPYWKTNGVLLRDPDGFGVMICDQHAK